MPELTKETNVLPELINQGNKCIARNFKTELITRRIKCIDRNISPELIKETNIFSELIY